MYLAWELSTFSRQMETKLDHLIHCNREILTIISTLIERKLHPKLLRHDVFQQIAMDIQQTGESRILPMPSRSVSTPAIMPPVFPLQ